MQTTHRVPSLTLPSARKYLWGAIAPIVAGAFAVAAVLAIAARYITS